MNGTNIAGEFHGLITMVFYLKKMEKSNWFNKKKTPCKMCHFARVFSLYTEGVF